MMQNTETIKQFSTHLLIFALFLALPAFLSAQIAPQRIVAAGLTYQGHIDETQQKPDSAGPPLFYKHGQSLHADSLEETQDVSVPNDQEVYAALSTLDRELPGALQKRYDEFPVLLDYEVELCIYFAEELSLEEIESLNSIELQFAVCNDMSSRGVQIMGEGQGDEKLDYWTLAKSFPSFLPMGDSFFHELNLDQWPHWTLETKVQNDIRQNEKLRDMIYSPREMLRFLAHFHNGVIPAQTLYLTGTPEGIAFQPGWIARTMGRVLTRQAKLKISVKKAKRNPKFLRKNQSVSVSLKSEDSTVLSEVKSIVRVRL